MSHPDPSPMSLEAALERAADELSLAAHYRSSVRPLLRNPEGFWPRCCGAGCEPCAQTLRAVALRALVLMGTPRQAPVPL